MNELEFYRAIGSQNSSKIFVEGDLGSGPNSDSAA